MIHILRLQSNNFWKVQRSMGSKFTIPECFCLPLSRQYLFLPMYLEEPLFWIFSLLPQIKITNCTFSHHRLVFIILKLYWNGIYVHSPWFRFMHDIAHICTWYETFIIFFLNHLIEVMWYGKYFRDMGQWIWESDDNLSGEI